MKCSTKMQPSAIATLTWNGWGTKCTWDFLRSVWRNTPISLCSLAISWLLFSSSRLQNKWSRDWTKRKTRAKKLKELFKEELLKSSQKGWWYPFKTRSSIYQITWLPYQSIITSSPTHYCKWALIWLWWAYLKPLKASKLCSSKPDLFSSYTTLTTYLCRSLIWWSKTGWTWFWVSCWTKTTYGIQWMPKTRSRT